MSDWTIISDGDGDITIEKDSLQNIYIPKLSSNGYVSTNNGTGLLSVSSTIPWSVIATTPTTLSGYGITDAYNIYNHDGTLTGNRTLSGNNYSLSDTGLGQFLVRDHT